MDIATFTRPVQSAFDHLAYMHPDTHVRVLFPGAYEHGRQAAQRAIEAMPIVLTCERQGSALEIVLRSADEVAADA